MLRFRPHRACLDGEGDGQLDRRLKCFADPIQLVWMVKEILRFEQPGDILFTILSELDGAYQSTWTILSSPPSCSPSAQGGRGPTRRSCGPHPIPLPKEKTLKRFVPWGEGTFFLGHALGVGVAFWIVVAMMVAEETFQFDLESTTYATRWPPAR